MANWELLAGMGEKGVQGYPGRRVKNALMNAEFQIWQRGTSFANLADASFFADQYRYFKTSTAVVNVTQDSSVPDISLTGGRQFGYSAKFACTTADSSIASTDICSFLQAIEGPRAMMFYRQPLVLTFYVKSSKTGIYSCCLKNNPDRSWVAEFTINSANTWEKKTILIDATPSSGTWPITIGAAGVILSWALAGGTSFQTSTLSTWNSDTKQQSSNQVNWLDSATATFFITGVQLEIGTIDTPFDSIPFDDDLRNCQRFYWKSFPYATAPVTAAGIVGALAWWRDTSAAGNAFPYVHHRFPVKMAFAPTITTYNPVSANANWRNTTANADNTVSVGTSKSEDTVFIVGTTAVTTQQQEVYIHAAAECVI